MTFHGENPLFGRYEGEGHYPSLMGIMKAVATRKTRQKTAIRAVFERTGRPLTTAEVLEIAQRDVARLGIATVYRSIKTLLDEGWLVPVELPGETARYEIAGKGHHHHFHCESCGSVFELDGCQPAIERLAKPGFIVRSHEVVLYGTCAECDRRNKRVRQTHA
jgi:Fur family ferric uptake transcriptional regulator